MATMDGMSPRDQSRRLEDRIIGLRGDLGGLLGELDRRRHEALDVGNQLRRHATGVVALSAASAVLVGVGWARHRRRTGGADADRAVRVEKAVERLIEHPERVAVVETTLKKVTSAMLAAAAAVLVRRGLQYFVSRAVESRDDAVARGPLRGGRHRPPLSAEAAREGAVAGHY